MKKILCFGEVLWDAFGDEKKAGGAPMNVARHLVQQNMYVAFASRVGTDASGDELVEFLRQNGLYSGLIQHDVIYPTCEVTVQLDETNQATYIIPQPVSWDNIQLDNMLRTAAAGSAGIVYGSLACRMETTRNTLLALLRESRAMKIFDVNLRPPHYTVETIEALAAYADLIKMNDEEINLLIEGKGSLHEKIEKVHEKYHTHTICVTRGGDGALVWHEGEFFEHPGFKVDVADTVGAGDAFLATFVAGLLNKQLVQKVLARACAVGAYVASKRGANPIYDHAEISSIMA
jgi:fructokinase